MLSSTQPESISAILTRGDASARFGNRFVFVYGAAAHDPAWNDVVIDMQPAVDPLQSIRGWAALGRRVDFGPEPFTTNRAFRAWADFHDEVVYPLQRSGELYGRAVLVAKKVMLLLALNDRSSVVTERHVRAVRRLWPMIADGWRLVGHKVGRSKLDEAIDVIMAWLRTNPDAEETVGVFCHRAYNVRSNYDKDLAKNAIHLGASRAEIEEASRLRGEKLRFRLVK